MDCHGKERAVSLHGGEAGHAGSMEGVVRAGLLAGLRCGHAMRLRGGMRPCSLALRYLLPHDDVVTPQACTQIPRAGAISMFGQPVS